MACSIWDLTAPTVSGESSLVDFIDCDLNFQQA